MKEFYVIQEIDGFGFWDNLHRKFRGYLFTHHFISEEELRIFAKKENIGVFKITKIFDTK